MAGKPIERLLFSQGGRCFFCDEPLAAPRATVEHLVARSNGGSDSDENCVACCEGLNRLLGRMSLKEKLGVILNQRGKFRCPCPARAASGATTGDGLDEQLAQVVANLRKRGESRPSSVETLKGTIHHLFGQRLGEAAVAALVTRLEAARVITIRGEKVSYSLPPDKGGASAGAHGRSSKPVGTNGTAPKSRP